MSASHQAPPAAASEPAPVERRALALRDALVDRGLVEAGEAEALAHRAVQELSPANGARVVARAWVDPDFRQRLLANATAAAKELGIEGIEGRQMVALENTATTHNVIVCTQCSCTAWPLLGLPPDWYKAPSYRARVVREARALLAEMGLQLPAATNIPRLGYQRRDAIFRVADATSGDRAFHGRTTRQSCYSRCTDRGCSH
jgi:nitrile hydratase subunit alpha